MPATRRSPYVRARIHTSPTTAVLISASRTRAANAVSEIPRASAVA
jgi:hypothetical protein